MREKRLPDLGALSRHLEGMRVGAFLRGVEATLTGSVIVGKDGALRLRVAGTGQIVGLAPLRRKIQWDVAGNHAQAATDQERAAYEQLRAQPPQPSSPVEVTGPLTQTPDNGHAAPTLEVRGFRHPLAPAQAGGVVRR